MRLIDADAVVSEFEWLKSVANESSKSEIDEYLQRVKRTPTADAAPLVHGRWIQTDKADIVWCECSVCGDRRISTWFGKTVKSFNYCPKCGAKMDEQKED